MYLADLPSVPATPPQIAVVSTLDGVTTVLVTFLFVCLVMPSLVKSRPQYYVAMVCLLGVIVLHTLSLVFGTSPSVALGVGVGTGVLQLVAFLLLVLSVGGLTVKKLAGDLAGAYEVIRRGETQKEVIIPIGDQAFGRPRRARGDSAEPAGNVYRIDSPPSHPGPVSIDDEDEGT
jgi:hypothetical protein